jgi:peroxiredoxin
VRRYILSGGLLLAAIVGMLTIRYPSPPTTLEPALEAPESRMPAPDFALIDSGGSTFQLANNRGKVVLLNFWATWCGPCEVEIPWFIEFQKTYKDRGFTVVGASTDYPGWKLVRPFIERRHMNYPVIISNPELAASYHHVEALPTTFLIDRQGRVAARHIGLASRRTYQAEILQLLSQ